jgi:hypothetical protein
MKPTKKDLKILRLNNQLPDQQKSLKFIKKHLKNP